MASESAGSCRKTCPRCPTSKASASRAKPNALRISSPGRVRCLSSAAENGLFLPSPSEAVDPSFAAKAMKADREKCIEAGASDYISKPLDIDQLLSMLRVWLYGRKVARA